MKWEKKKIYLFKLENSGIKKGRKYFWEMS